MPNPPDSAYFFEEYAIDDIMLPKIAELSREIR